MQETDTIINTHDRLAALADRCRCGHIRAIHGPECAGYASDPEYMGYFWAVGEVWSAGESCDCGEFEVQS